MNNFPGINRDFQHIPVLGREVTEYLRIRAGGKYIDGTIGGGGHTSAILKSGGIVLGIDLDQDSILHLKKKFEPEILERRLVLFHGNFSQMKDIAEKSGFKKADGILLDLGVSSNQIDHSGRGFSFLRDEPLDMRMDKTFPLNAGEIVNTWGEDRLYEIFAKYGEDTHAREVARQIVLTRSKRPIGTSRDLAQLISAIIPSGGIHPATKIFQALRIAVNAEIENLKIGLDSGFKLLNEGARFAVISFHSLEDRMVKLKFLKQARLGEGKVLTKRPITAGMQEIRANRRSRSAKLRVFEKTKA